MCAEVEGVLLWGQLVHQHDLHPYRTTSPAKFSGLRSRCTTASRENIRADVQSNWASRSVPIPQPPFYLIRFDSQGGKPDPTASEEFHEAIHVAITLIHGELTTVLENTVLGLERWLRG